MLKVRLNRLVSVLLASVSAILPMSHVPGVVTTATQAQETSSFASVDVTTLSAAELTALVAATVASLPPGLSDEAIVEAVGRALAPATVGLSAAEFAALLSNVALILTDLGIDVAAADLVDLLTVAVADAGGFDADAGVGTTTDVASLGPGSDGGSPPGTTY